MAFVRTVSRDDFQFQTFKHGNSWLVILNIGYDDQIDLSYSLVVGLEPAVGGAIEYFFHIVEADGETGGEHTYWSGKETAHFILKDDRKVILEAVLTATQLLLKNAQPSRVEVTTYDPDPPDKALVKHLMIGRVFELGGYQVHAGNSYHGKRVWWMDRAT